MGTRGVEAGSVGQGAGVPMGAQEGQQRRLLHVLLFYLKETRYKASVTQCEQQLALDSGHRGVYHRKLCTFSVFQKFLKKKKKEYGFGGRQDSSSSSLGMERLFQGA